MEEVEFEINPRVDSMSEGKVEAMAFPSVGNHMNKEKRREDSCRVSSESTNGIA